MYQNEVLEIVKESLRKSIKKEYTRLMYNLEGEKIRTRYQVKEKLMYMFMDELMKIE